MAHPLLRSPSFVFTSAVLLRVILLFYSHFQDTHSPVKYTDIDYFVFTDASRFVSQGRSPYDRETYRYTPLLAWLLLPTTTWFDFGKVLFALGDILAGWLLMCVLRDYYSMEVGRAVSFAAVWLLNPMVANISTRGSSEGLLGVLAAGLLLATLKRRISLAGVILGFGVHFKIYPFIYASSLVWWLEEEEEKEEEEEEEEEDNNAVPAVPKEKKLWAFANRDRIALAVYSFGTFMALNFFMYIIYGRSFIDHSFLHHLTRLDHRHNFSPYNAVLHLNSSPASQSTMQLERLAFMPQLFLSAVAIPLALAKKDLAGSMLCQTFAFVTFNKVCTSQYFLWYLIFLPLYLPNSSLLKSPTLGLTALGSWVVGQVFWLYEGYKLEFLGRQAFFPGLWIAGLVFFAVNCWILGVLIQDISSWNPTTAATLQRMAQKKKK